MEIIEWFINIVSKNPEEFRNKRILEVGGRNVNGSVRPLIEKFCLPEDYIGIDIEDGKYVDIVLSAEKVLEYFGEESFDVVISTELLEHTKDWRIVINNMKGVLKRKGIIYITTCSYGFQYHGYPYDFWRYEIGDMKQIFSDFNILDLRKNPLSCGVFLKAEKQINYKQRDLKAIPLYSICIGKRTVETPQLSFTKKLLLLLRKYYLIKKVI